jgi:aspartate/methionine/tyrosine aminotransferase
VAASRWWTKFTWALSFEAEYGQTALALDDNIISINSFSKYFNMTGWRLGWMVVPEKAGARHRAAGAKPVHLPQHHCPACRHWPALSRRAWRCMSSAAANSRPGATTFLPQLNAMGLTVPVMPDGAFYAWADCSAACAKLGVKDSWDFAYAVMNRPMWPSRPGATLAAQRPTTLCVFPPPAPWSTCRKPPLPACAPC